MASTDVSEAKRKFVRLVHEFNRDIEFKIFDFVKLSNGKWQYSETFSLAQAMVEPHKEICTGYETNENIAKFLECHGFSMVSPKNLESFGPDYYFTLFFDPVEDTRQLVFNGYLPTKPPYKTPESHLPFNARKKML